MAHEHQYLLTVSNFVSLLCLQSLYLPFVIFHSLVYTVLPYCVILYAWCGYWWVNMCNTWHLQMIISTNPDFRHYKIQNLMQKSESLHTIVAIHNILEYRSLNCTRAEIHSVEIKDAILNWMQLHLVDVYLNTLQREPSHTPAAVRKYWSQLQLPHYQHGQ